MRFSLIVLSVLMLVGCGSEKENPKPGPPEPFDAKVFEPLMFESKFQDDSTPHGRATFLLSDKPLSFLVPVQPPPGAKTVVVPITFALGLRADGRYSFQAIVWSDKYNKAGERLVRRMRSMHGSWTGIADRELQLDRLGRLTAVRVDGKAGARLDIDDSDETYELEGTSFRAKDYPVHFRYGEGKTYSGSVMAPLP